MRSIKNYKKMSKERLLSTLDESECNSVKHSEDNFNNARIKRIRENLNKLRDWFLKLKMKEIRRNLYEIENKKNLSESKNKRDWPKSYQIRRKFFKAQ